MTVHDFLYDWRGDEQYMTAQQPCTCPRCQTMQAVTDFSRQAQAERQTQSETTISPMELSQ
jgi:hypothetical protein